MESFNRLAAPVENSLDIFRVNSTGKMSVASMILMFFLRTAVDSLKKETKHQD